MIESAIFILGTAFFVWVSWRSLRNPLSHGFYRFIAWECMLALVIINFPMWTIDPFTPRQIISWSLLLVSIFLAVHAFRLLRAIGQPSRARGEPELLPFERTSTLVTTGAYRYIRHPMYAALLYLAWGAFLKDISLPSVGLIIGSSLALYFTARRDEEECKRHFGETYTGYMTRTKRFVPFVF